MPEHANTFNNSNCGAQSAKGRDTASADKSPTGPYFWDAMAIRYAGSWEDNDIDAQCSDNGNDNAELFWRVKH